MSTDNQFFSFSRLSLLARKSMVEDWRAILLSCAGLLGLLVLTGILVSHFCYDRHIQPQYYSSFCNKTFFTWIGVTAFVGGVYLASVSFRSLATPPGALSTLMVPASQFEKYVMRWLVAVPLFVLLMFVSAYVADWIRVGYASANYGMEVRPLPWSKIMFNPEAAGYFKGFFIMMFMIYLCVQSFFFLGAVVWPRRSMAKSFLTGGALIFAYIWFGVWIHSIFHRDGGLYFYSGPLFFDDEANMRLFVELFLALVSLLNYWLAYRRFQESEIINRW